MRSSTEYRGWSTINLLALCISACTQPTLLDGGVDAPASDVPLEVRDAPLDAGTGDVPADAGLGPPSASLELVAISERDVPDCFPGLSRSGLHERVFAYKRVFAQTIDGVPREIHPRAYVLTPPGFEPGVSASLPVIAMFHGGGWVNGSPVLWIPEARYFAARGVLAIVFQYRLGTLHDGTPRQATADALSAIRWIRTYARELGADPDRIVTVGDSAGGHLSLATASIAGISGEDDGASAVSARPLLNMALYPVSQVTTPGLEEIDPYRHLDASNTIPTLILHGTADALPITPYASSVAYCARHAELSSTECTVSPFEGSPHNFFPDPTLYSSATVYLDTWLFDQGLTGGIRADLYMYAFYAAEHCRFSYAQFAALESEYMLPATGDGPVW